MEHKIQTPNASAIAPPTVEPSKDTQALEVHDTIYTKKKRSGSSYTPEGLAVFVASQIVKNLSASKSHHFRILDPAVGDGELVLALAEQLRNHGFKHFTVYGFDTNGEALAIAERRIIEHNDGLKLALENKDFLLHVLDKFSGDSDQVDLFQPESDEKFDIVIANPPYVRTQILGSKQATELANQFGLSGRTDLYHAFILAIGAVLKQGGKLGIIVSNRFMTTKSGLAVRECFLNNYELHHVFDLGDTKLFDEAVLPAVVIGERSSNPGKIMDIPFTRSHSTKAGDDHKQFTSVLEPIDEMFDGIVSVGNTSFEIIQGVLDFGNSHSDVWRVSTEKSSQWLSTVEEHQAYSFRDIGKIRVGVKTTADKVFIRRDWDRVSSGDQPEDRTLLPLLTHKEARRWKAKSDGQARILYTHEFIEGKRRPIDFGRFPKASRYLNSQRDVLEKRSYVRKAGREWYEIWVPQDPRRWPETKLVFRDIAEYSTFFLDDDGSVINGDCYWMVVENHIHTDILWLAMAVGNSSFILRYYDERFHNKLYANRRRFMTQYVEQFPIPDPNGKLGMELIGLSKRAFEASRSNDDSLKEIENQLDEKVWKAFGLVKE